MRLRPLMQMAFWFACLLVGGEVIAQRAEPIQGKAAVELKFDKQQYYLGELCTVEFVLKNTDEKDIAYSAGGDYRGSGRALRFRVQAVDADGAVVPEADPVMCMGGLSGIGTLQPGKEWRQTLRSLDYLKLTKPGKYTIRITHDLGWKDPQAPIGETQVEFLMPDQRQAEKILGAISAELKRADPERNWQGWKVPSLKDLALPVYLPLLKKRALAGGGGNRFFFMRWARFQPRRSRWR